MKRGVLGRGAIPDNPYSERVNGTTARGPTPSYYNSDISSERNISHDCSGGGCCLGGWVSTFLGGCDGDMGQQDPLTNTGRITSTNNDDPTTLEVLELNTLSLKEREVVYEDLHGVSMIEDESNLDLVNQRIMEMKSELENIPRSKKIAYLIAMEEFGETGKSLCQDRSLHPMFLRSDRWDSKMAATRFVGWLDWKLELFGRGVLCHRHITLDKLDKDSRTIVESGRLQILSQRDTSGRTVLFDWLGRHLEFSGFGSIKCMLQVFFYMLMATVEDDVQTQQMGILYIIYAVDGTLAFSADDLKLISDCSRMLPMLPIRTNSVHYCFDDSKLRPIIKMIQMAIGSHIRARFRSHEGNHTEVQYSLMTYGIPTDVLPPVAMNSKVTTPGNIKTTHHMRWYKRRKVRDSALTNRVGGSHGKDDFYGIDRPGRFDVLLGKGKPIQNSPGNRRLQELLKTHYEEYDATETGGKHLFAQKVLQMVQEPVSGGGTDNFHITACGGIRPQFLKQRDDGWWEPVPHEVAIKKILHSFRAVRQSIIGALGAASTTVGALPTAQSRNSGSPSSTTGIGNGTTKRLKVEKTGKQFEKYLSQHHIGDDTTDQDGLDLDNFNWI